MSNESMTTFKLIKTPLAIGLTTSMLAGCSMLPSLPTANVLGKVTTPNSNKEPVKVRHANPTINNSNAVETSAGTGQKAQAFVSEKPVEISGVQGKLWNGVIVREEGKTLWNEQSNPSIALAKIEQAKQHWLSAQRNSLDTSLKNAPNYLHYLISQAELRNLPEKLALLPLIESGYNPRAGKNAGANAPAGLWQITPDVAKQLKMKMNTSYDARYDIKASTNSAYLFLSGLNRTYKNDWALTLAAYHGGATVVDKAMADNKAQGKPTDFWSLNLPEETMQFVPRFLALVEIIEHSNRYGVKLPFADTVRQLQFVRVGNDTKLDMVAPIAQVPLDTLKMLNAGLLRDRVDVFTPRDIILPALVPSTIIQQIEKLPVNYTYNTPYIPPLDVPNEPATSNNPNPYPNPNQPNNPPPLNRPPKGYEVNQPVLNRPPRYDARQGNRYQPQNNSYVVQAGDTLSELAQGLRIPRSVLADFNQIDPESLLREGQVLYLPSHDMMNNRGNVSANRRQHQPKRRQHRKSRINNNGHYKVKKGDTLLGIANKLHVSARAIASLNGFDTEYLVKDGETLTVPVSHSQKPGSRTVYPSNYFGKYQVVRGDSLSLVASKFGLTKNQLARANNLDPESYLFTGTSITIPKKHNTANRKKQRQVSARKKTNKRFTRAKNIQSYRVKTGDSLTKLAKRYNTDIRSLAKLNGISPLSDLYTDTIIKVPKNQVPSDIAENREYKVQKGEGLIKLAERFGISAKELAKMNGISATADLNLGQKLIVPNN